jgi:hypothetical protein
MISNVDVMSKSYLSFSSWTTNGHAVWIYDQTQGELESSQMVTRQWGVLPWQIMGAAQLPSLAPAFVLLSQWWWRNIS